MKIWRGISEARAAKVATAVTVGTFDGVHLGHRDLIGRARAKAEELQIASAVLTWDRHPAQTLRPDRAPPLLTTLNRKIELIEATGVDACLILPFDEELSQWSPERFIDDVLAEGMSARHVVVGDGWRFGRRASGDVTLLARRGAEVGFEVEVASLVEVDGDAVSSSRARAAVAAGDVALAARLLQRPFDVDGEVVRGASRGRDLGFPTANLPVRPELVAPARGVYAGRARARGRWYPAATNVGVNPTFGGKEGRDPIQIESYLIDFDADLYGETIRIEFRRRLRDEQAFAGPDELVAQMKKDVEATLSAL